LDPVLKAARAANYIKTLRRDLLKVSEAAGVEHPALIGPRAVELLDNLADGRLLDEVYGYQPGWGFPSAADRDAIIAIMSATAEPEARTEGPPETAEEGQPASEVAGDTGAGSMDI
jgi:glutamate synthase (ferredoxin)